MLRFCLGYVGIVLAAEVHYNTHRMPIPLIPIAIGALLGSAGNKKKEDFQAVKGRKRKDGTTGKAYVRKKKRSR